MQYIYTIYPNNPNKESVFSRCILYKKHPRAKIQKNCWLRQNLLSVCIYQRDIMFPDEKRIYAINNANLNVEFMGIFILERELCFDIQILSPHKSKCCTTLRDNVW